jgi:crotonobetainyl-CoA:carnitine CoA-transferase CaiB-like acyl-CoA transferase
VLDPIEAGQHSHLAERKVYQVHDGVFQAASAPRFSGFPDIAPSSVSLPGEDWAAILSECGIAPAQALAGGVAMPKTGCDA